MVDWYIGVQIASIVLGLLKLSFFNICIETNVNNVSEQSELRIDSDRVRTRETERHREREKGRKRGQKGSRWMHDYVITGGCIRSFFSCAKLVYIGIVEEAMEKKAYEGEKKRS